MTIQNEKTRKIVKGIKGTEINRLITEFLLKGSNLTFPLKKEEYRIMDFFLSKLSSIFELYIKKDRDYQMAWRNMPWQSCDLRTREKLQRLLSMNNVDKEDIVEEGGDSIMYILFMMYQFEHGYNLEPSSKKAQLIQNHLDAINMILKVNDEKYLFQVENAPLTTWIDYDKDTMPIEIMLHELKNGANIKVGTRFIVGHKGNKTNTFLIVDTEGKVFGLFDPYRNLKMNEDGLDLSQN